MSHWEDENKESNKARAAEIKARREKNPDHYKKASPSHQKQLDKYYKEYLGKQFESRGHKVLDTWFKNRQAQQNAKIPTPAERKELLDKQQDKKIKVDETTDMGAGMPDTQNQPERNKAGANRLVDLSKLQKKNKGVKSNDYDDSKDQACSCKESVDNPEVHRAAVKKFDSLARASRSNAHSKDVHDIEGRKKSFAFADEYQQKANAHRDAYKKATGKDLDECVKESVDKEHPIYKEYQSLKAHSIKDLRDMIKRQHRIIDTSEFRTKEHAISHILNNKHGHKRVAAAFGEETIHEQQAGEVKSHKYTMASKKPARLSPTVADAKDTNHRQMNNLVHKREGGVHASNKTFKEGTEMLQGHPIGGLVICKKTHRVGTVQGIEGDQYTVVYGDGSTETGPADWWTCSYAEALNPEQKKKQLRDALDRHTEKALAANKAGDDEAVRVHQQYMNKIKNQMAKMSRNESVETVFDSTENQLDEISKATLGSYAKRAASQSIGYSAALGTMKSTDDATQAQRKLRNRYQGTQKAINKLMAKEEVELGEAWNVNNRNPQRGIKVGHKVRSYDFPGMHDDHYIEGHVVGETPSSYHIKVGKVVRYNKEIPIPAHMGHVEAPKGKSLWTDAYAVHKIMGKQEAVQAPVEEPKGGAKTFSKNFGSRVRKGTKV